MPCKHEGGMDPCERTSNHHCKIWDKTWRKAYKKAHLRKTGTPKSAARDRGAAGEHFVIHWLLARGFQVGGPYNQNGKHDLFVKIGKWKTVQVKLGQVNMKTGSLFLGGSRRDSITSDLIAVVDLEGQRIRWISNTDEPVPEELL